MRLLLTGGGTAGHVYPLLSVQEELSRKLKGDRLEILYLGSKGGIEEQILKTKNIPSFFIYSGKWRRYWKKWLPALFLNLKDLILVFVGFFQSFLVITRFRPDIVVAKGGYVTLPVVLAARLCNIPIIVHESDVVVGLSNKLCAKLAQKICVSFPAGFYKGLPKKRIVYTGNPVRREFYLTSKAKQRTRLPTILITGGSQGSKKINQVIYGILPKLLTFAKVIHLVGVLDFPAAERVKQGLKKDLKKRYFVYGFLEEEMPQVMHGADLVVSRAGANTLFEIAASAKPSILIPLKTAASDHQTKNAQIFEKNKAAILVEEDDLNAGFLLKIIRKLLSDKEKLKEMGERARRLSMPKAASKIAEEIIKLSI